MNSNYQMEGKTLRTDGFSVEFEHIIQDIKYLNGIYVVLLNIPNEVDDMDNVYGIDLSGKMIWRIQNPVEAFNLKGDEQGYNYMASSVYVHINLSEDGIFTATTFFALKYVFDYKTGKLLKQEYGRW